MTLLRRSDQARLVSDSDDEEDRTPRLFDAAHTHSDVEAPSAIVETDESGLGSAKWFILEPAVFLIFMARSLIGEFENKFRKLTNNYQSLFSFTYICIYIFRGGITESNTVSNLRLCHAPQCDRM